jgi:beta-lactamase regulating signal transducer with metallopeptidase domain
LLCVLLALHWFNPLLWLAFIRARLDREAASDAQVLDSGNQAQRVAYRQTLLKVAIAFSHHGLSLGFVGIIQRGTALLTRIRSIANQPKLNRLMKTIPTLSVIHLTFFGITSAEQPTAAQGSAITIGQTEFRQLDSIRITQLQRWADFMPFTADYDLARRSEVTSETSFN